MYEFYFDGEDLVIKVKDDEYGDTLLTIRSVKDLLEEGAISLDEDGLEIDFDEIEIKQSQEEILQAGLQKAQDENLSKKLSSAATHDPSASLLSLKLQLQATKN